MLSVSLLFAYLVILWLYLLWRRRSLYRVMFQLPGPIGYPILGSLHKLWNNEGVNTLGNWTLRYGPSYLFWVGPTPMYIVSDPGLIQELLNSPHAINKSQLVYGVIQQLLGAGILTLDNPVWSKHRRLLNVAFAHNILLSFMPIFNEESTALVQEFDTFVGQGEKELLSRFQNFSLRTATQTTMGTEVKKEDTYKSDILVNKYKRYCILNYSLNIVTIMLLKVFLQLIIDEKLDNSNNSSSKIATTTFIDVAIEQFRNRVFNYSNLEEEANTIVFGAFETTALTMTYTLMNLAMFPEYQERVFEEIKSVFPNAGDFEVTYEEIQKLEYLDMVINESMRLMPTFPITARKISQDLKLSNGIVLPKGLEIGISVLQTHRSKDIWGPDAHTYNPDHFLPSNLQDKHPYAFLPFLKGKRSCIGAKYASILMKMTLAKILRNYKFSTNYRLEDLVIVDYVTLKFKETPGLQLERRD
ncbi:hypothetical protein KR093_011322 [Drosophila rubida]|uniref:Uncharacterized protein n=1 Tax=Drosophila rubida TaxID=30044 RepID=A0AAD4JUZ7_9MUSC|nr:hypothetical protein KR093_011322 [Drosophila rubida]